MPVISDKVLYVQDHYSTGYVITHPYGSPLFKSLIQFTDRIDSSRLYFRYQLDENNPFYDFQSIQHAAILGDTVLAVEGEGYWANYGLYDSLAALNDRYKIVGMRLKSLRKGASFRFYTDESGRRYIRTKQHQRLLLDAEDFDRLIVTNYNYWVETEAEKKKLIASKSPAYSLPRSISNVVSTLTMLSLLLASEFYF